MSLSVETYVLAKNYTDSVIDSGGAGVVPNITMTAVQLEADEQPTVTKGGTNVNPTFELGIPKGEPGVGVPVGGTTGQVLAKASNNNYDMVWVDQTGGGGGNIVLQFIEITTPPSKTSYMAGEIFDNTGMVVTAYYNFGLSQIVTGYTVSPSGGLTGDITEITINYSEGGVIKSATYPITVTRNTGTLTINPTSISLDADTLSQTVEITYNGDGVLNIQNGNPQLIQTSLSENILTVTSLGDTSETITVNISAPQTGNYTAASANLIVKNYVTVSIYGAIWDGSASSAWSRTDGAELFTDPNPAVNNGTGSSPFDNIMPWSGMVKYEDPVAGTLVAIPKYWYKWTRSGASMQLQISPEPQEGFYVSPAHADRGDGQGERDMVYVGRYHCNSSYKSQSGNLPINNITRYTARTNIHNLGAEYWQYDYAIYWTICMLYLVEFANWNSQAMIGYGCSPNSENFDMGLTDTMQYHTGTSAENRNVYGCCQYRNIEGLWDNERDWVDGIYFDSDRNIFCFNRPAAYGDGPSGAQVQVGTAPQMNGYCSAWSTSNVLNYEYAIFPNESNGTDSTYICDNIVMVSSTNYSVLCIGGDDTQHLSRGMFYMIVYSSNTSSNAMGCRLQKLPNNV